MFSLAASGTKKIMKVTERFKKDIETLNQGIAELAEHQAQCDIDIEAKYDQINKLKEEQKASHRQATQAELLKQRLAEIVGE